MPTQDTTEIKNKIISLVKTKGPSIPVQIAREVEMSILFTSAFLSELLSEQKLKMSNMKIGSSSLYHIQGQEPQLEKFAHHLKSKEKDAFTILKERKFLKDKEQPPAIRVALRAIKDFAIPFKYNEEIYWRYFITPTSDFKPNIKKDEPEMGNTTKITQTQKPEGELIEKSLGIFDDEGKEIKVLTKKEQPKQKPKIKSKIKTSTKEERFFNRIKEHLDKRSIQILDIKSVNKNEIVLNVLEQNQEKLLIAYNKKKLSEEDITRAHKKAQEANSKYTIISLGNQSKKLSSFIDAIKDLSSIDKVE